MAAWGVTPGPCMGVWSGGGACALCIEGACVAATGLLCRVVRVDIQIVQLWTSFVVELLHGCYCLHSVHRSAGPSCTWA